MPKWPVMLILSFCYLGIMIFNYGRLTQRPGPFIRSYDDMMQVFPSVLFLWVLTMIVIKFINFPVPPQKIVMICPKCEETKNDDGVLTCSCGGHFVDLRTMKWVEPAP